ncbi:MAG TPA: DciA family protein [Usitatibacter sp.]|nr:DciA family protein [Usitatibacter sp.]
MAPESIAKYLGETPELRPLSERLLQIKRLQRRYRTLVPEKLAEASRVCAVDGTTVVVCASSGPVAAALRHIAPRLLQGLRSVRGTPKHSRDQEFTAIRIEVQVSVPPRKRPVVTRGEMPAEKLAALASGLADSPLKDALERIGGDQIARRTRSKT